ncbi:MAG: isoleucine--tRNA ligase [Treponema sp.]
MYKEVNPKVDFASQEEEILSFWEKNDVFKKSIENRKDAEEFVLFDGPPFATGLPHFGHFVPCTIKDIIPRYKTMKGYKVPRRFGWDCHGLPVENLIEKELSLNSKTDIEKYGVANFNEACRKSVLRYVAEWKKTITRLGRWVDFEADYKTMNPDYMESIWHVVKSLFEKDLLYAGHYILPYCPRCSTVLSNHELNMDGYKNVQDPAITVKFKISGRLKDSKARDLSFPENTFFLVWTTTPWTLPSNLALAVGGDFDYVLVEEAGSYYILLSTRLEAVFPNKKDEKPSYKIIRTFKGNELEGLLYEPIFPYFSHLKAKEDGKTIDGSVGAFRVLCGSFVTTEDGTGVVHMAPGFGEDDNALCKSVGLPTVCPIDAECKFTKEVPEYEGIFVKKADKQIIERLKDEDKLFKRDAILHSYPHCWRCSSPLIYRAIESWFVNVSKIKETMIRVNDEIHWQPRHIKNGRFGKWLEGARDWAISRNRYWGNPIPIWRCKECGEVHCVGSRKELEELSGKKVTDLHKHFVDDITFPCKKCGSSMHRISEVLDCWFESGAMPYAQNHYPFEKKEEFEKKFPADFIAEGLDQTRGWFYTLTVLSSALFESKAFKACVVSGLVLAKDGKKMSKSLRNYTDPNEVVDSFGADALRLFLVNSSVVKAEDLKYTDEGIKDVLKGIIIPFWNSYSFYVTYANIDGIYNPQISKEPSYFTNLLDRWLLSITEKLVLDVTNAFDDYDLSAAIPKMVSYIDLLNNWYIRRSRRRFWKSENDVDKMQAYQALYVALKRFSLLFAPVVPFITEMIWQNLKCEGEPLSIHLCDYPTYDEKWRDEQLEFKMETVQKCISMGRSLRYQFNLKIRQPLKAVEIVTRNKKEQTVLLEMEDSILEELNVKEVIFHEREYDMVDYTAKANYKVLGKKLGNHMKEVAKKIEGFSSSDIQGLLDGATVGIETSDGLIEITQDELIINRIEKNSLKVVNDGTLTIGLDTKITEELLLEGYVRDLVRGIQNLRKYCDLQVTDRIILYVYYDEKSKDCALLEKAFNTHKEYIASETLSTELFWDVIPNDVLDKIDVEASDQMWSIGIKKHV